MRFTSVSVKRRAAFATVLSGALVLSACGGGGGNGTAAEEYDEDREIELTVAWWGNDERAQLTSEVFDIFEERHPNITIQSQPTGDPEDLFDRLSTDFAAGGGTDLFTLGGAMPQEYGGAGMLLDLEEVSEHVDLDPYEDFMVTNAVVDDTLYGLPTGGNAIGLLINETIFEEAGVEVPDEDWGWDEFVEAAGEISANHDDALGLDLRIQDIISTYTAQLNDLGLYNWDGELAVTEEELASWYELELDLVENDGVPDPSVVVEYHNVTPDQSLFGTRQAAMVFSYSNQMTPYTQALGDDEVSMRLPPTETDNPGVAVLPSQFWSINANTEEPQAAAMLLDFILNDEEAAEILQDDRGLPFNPEMLEVVEPLLDPINSEAAAYIQEVLEQGVVAPPQPAGGAEMNALSQRIESDILFGNSTVDEGVQEWMDYMENALEQGE
ncbi:ABC transporter substrate-binding protein [Nesterenkonia haasae]|uniref:ABC transporter substrate-binding protein n=1 Tax=Nesterenkonia haasae TaxID=2587813 RepID=UPI001390755F|nr:extracellular solute-binding protein [Nesterenkonia haasae]NDK30290.1 extracellular solute-binding protein [Nesterenkonia haasae]